MSRYPSDDVARFDQQFRETESERNDRLHKAAYVKRQRQTRDHTCHWPGCEKQVPPAMWGCKQHWFALPKNLRDKIWATYRPGQEVTMTPSAAYLEAAKEVQAWIAGQRT